MPYQLTGGYPTGDVPEDADVHEHDVLPGDLIVLGTDGLFDNLDDEVMAKTVMAEVPLDVYDKKIQRNKVNLFMAT